MNHHHSHNAHADHRRHLILLVATALFLLNTHWLVETFLDPPSYGSWTLALPVFALSSVWAFHALSPFFSSGQDASPINAKTARQRRVFFLCILAATASSLIFATKGMGVLAQWIHGMADVTRPVSASDCSACTKGAYVLSIGLFGLLFWLAGKDSFVRVVSMVPQATRTSDGKSNATGQDLYARQNIIIFLSTPRNPEATHDRSALWTARLGIDASAASEYAEFLKAPSMASLVAIHNEIRNTACDPKKSIVWNWLMPYLNIHQQLTQGPDTPALRIVVIPSIDSFNQLAEFRLTTAELFGADLLKHMFLASRSDSGGALVSIEQAYNKDDVTCHYEKVDTIHAKLKHCMAGLEHMLGRDQDDNTVIDITSGTKVTSVAASLYTIGRTIEVLYLDTNTYEPFVFDFHARPKAAA